MIGRVTSRGSRPRRRISSYSDVPSTNSIVMKVTPPGLAEIVGPDDVAVGDSAGEADFLFEAFQHARIELERRPEHLDRDRFLQLAVGGAVDHPHAAGPEQFLHFRPAREHRTDRHTRCARSPPAAGGRGPTRARRAQEVHQSLLLAEFVGHPLEGSAQVADLVRRFALDRRRVVAVANPAGGGHQGLDRPGNATGQPRR